LFQVHFEDKENKELVKVSKESSLLKILQQDR